MTGKAQKKKDSSRTAEGREKVKWQGYVNWSMSHVDKKVYKAWGEHRSVYENEVPSIIESGYSIKLSFDDYHQSVVCGLFCQNPTDANAGWCLTARAEDPYEALCRAMFIHYVCFDGLWPTERELDTDGWK